MDILCKSSVTIIEFEKGGHVTGHVSADSQDLFMILLWLFYKNVHVTVHQVGPKVLDTSC